jgi:hypothetical protein
MDYQDSLVALEKEWPGFVAAVRARLEVGAREYGDASLGLAPAELLGEIKQEVLDVMGWGFLLWLKLLSIERKLSGERPCPAIADKSPTSCGSSSNT